MRHRLGIRLGITAALGTVLLAAGCADRGSVDGDLTNGWATMASAAGFVPAASTCHGATFNPVGPRDSYEEIDCLLLHRAETAHVGTYESPAADADEPPAEGSAGARAAYQVCDKRVATYVGGPWRTARLWIGVTHPSDAAWTGGSRWYRCEVLELSSVEDDGGLVQRTGSVQGALAAGGTGDLALGCYAVQQDGNGAIGAMPAVRCSAKHNAEFVGVWSAKKLDYPTDDAGWARFHDGCRSLIATYVGVPDDKDLQFRAGVVSLPGARDTWALGDHSVRCYLWRDGAELTASLKGKGAKSLPIQYK